MANWVIFGKGPTDLVDAAIPDAKYLAERTDHLRQSAGLDRLIKVYDIPNGTITVTALEYVRTIVIDVVGVPILIEEKEELIEQVSEFFAYEFATTVIISGTTHMRYTYVGAKNGALVGLTKDKRSFVYDGTGTLITDYIGGENDLFVNGGDAIAQTVFSTGVTPKQRNAVSTTYTKRADKTLDVTSDCRAYAVPRWRSPLFSMGSPTVATANSMLHLIDDPTILTPTLRSQLTGAQQYVRGWVRYGGVYIAHRVEGIDALGIHSFYITNFTGATTGAGPVFQRTPTLPSWTSGHTLRTVSGRIFEHPTTWYFSPHSMRAVAIRAFDEVSPAGGPLGFELIGIHEIIFNPTYDSSGVLTNVTITNGRQIYHREASPAAVDYDYDDPDIIRYIETITHWGQATEQIDYSERHEEYGTGIIFQLEPYNIESWTLVTYTKKCVDMAINAQWRVIEASGSSPDPYRIETLVHMPGVNAMEGYLMTGEEIITPPNQDFTDQRGFQANIDRQNELNASHSTLSEKKSVFYVSLVSESILESVFSVRTWVYPDTGTTTTVYSPDPYTMTKFEERFGYEKMTGFIVALDLRHDAYAIWKRTQKHNGLASGVHTVMGRVVGYGGTEMPVAYAPPGISPVTGDTVISGVVPRSVPVAEPFSGSAQSLAPPVETSSGVGNTGWQQTLFFGHLSLNGVGLGNSWDSAYSMFYTHPNGHWSLWANIGNNDPGMSFDIVTIKDPKAGPVSGSHRAIFEASRPGIVVNYAANVTKLVRNAMFRDTTIPPDESE